MSLLRALATVGGLTAVSRVLGFARDVATAALLGAGVQADAFFIALRLPDLMRRLFAEGAFSSAFVPQFAHIRRQSGERAAMAFAWQALSLLTAAVGLVVLLGVAVMPWLVRVIAPGFGDEAGGWQTVTDYARLTFPYLLPVTLTALIGGILNGFGAVAAFAAAPVIFNGGMLAVLLGVAVFDWPAGTALAAGVSFAGLLQLGWMLAALRRRGIILRLAWPRWTAEMRALFQQVGPGALAVGAAQVNLTVDFMLASLLSAGAVSALAYADRLVQLPQGIVGLALGMAILPRLSLLAAAGDRTGFTHEFRMAVRAALLLGIPAAVGLALTAPTIVQVLFVRGAFTADDAVPTAGAVAAYALGIPMVVLVKALAALFFARGDTRTPLAAGLAVMVANVFFSLALMSWLGAIGIALATTFAAMVNLAWLGWGLIARGEAGLLTAGLGLPLLRITVAATAMAGYLVGVPRLIVGTGLPGWLLLTVLVGGGAAVYAAAIGISGEGRDWLSSNAAGSGKR